MKKMLCFLIMLWGGTLLAAQALDLPVAIVKLNKTTVISQKTFRDQVALYESTNRQKLSDPDKSKLLNSLIISELISQAADKQGLKATDDDLMKQYRSANPGVSDDMIRQTVEKQSGTTWDKAVVPLKRQLVVIKFFSGNPKMAELGKLTVGDQEVADFYAANSYKYVVPDFIRVSHIFFDTKINPKGSLAEIRARAEDVQKKIASGQATFEDEVYKESEDPGTKMINGDMGFIPRAFELQPGQQPTNIYENVGLQLVNRLGKQFLEDVFALKTGVVSPVLVSNAGLHILKVTQRIDSHKLSLDDLAYPGKENSKVRESIKQGLLQQKVAAAQDKIFNDVGEDLKTQADIKLYPQNM